MSSDIEQKYQALFAQSPYGILLVDTEGKILDFNETAHRDLGYTREEFANITIADVSLVESNVDIKARISRILERGSAEFETRHRTKQGEIRDVHVITKALTLSRQTLLHSIWQDITERKRAEEYLLGTKQELIEAQRIAHLGNWDLDLQTGKGKWSDESYRIFGFEPGTFEPTFNKFIDSVHPEDRKAVEAYFPDLLSGKLSQVELDLRIIRPSGEERIIYVKLEVLTDKNGKPFKLNGISLDITERMRAEVALKEKEERYRSLFESAKDGIFILGSKGFIDCNQRGADMYGLPKKELIGRSPIELSPEIQPNGMSSSRLAGEITESALKGVPQTFEWQSKRADGSLVDVEINLSRVELGGEICLQSIVRDITERKRLEQEIIKTQKLESIGTLAGGIAHDFNNLLQGVFGYISMAKMSLDRPDRIKTMLHQAEEALHLSVNLTTQLLTFSKGGKPVKKLIQLQPVIENAVKFALSGSQTGHMLDIATDLWPIEADEGQLAQVIQNIVLNANEAMAGRGTFSIYVGNADVPEETIPGLLKGGRFVRIEIRDSGTGISKQNLEKIFDPYFTTKQKGSGLGLATSYSIIRNHGGIIEVQSELGKGSTFTIYLPAAKETSIACETNSIMATDARKGKILLMDDEGMVRNVAKDMIESLGHEVQCAEDGEEAIKMFCHARESGSPFDVVILDLTVKGGMGGEDTFRKLKEMDPDVVAVVSSGYSDKTVVADFQKGGFSAFLNKPYTIDALRNCINKSINQP